MNYKTIISSLLLTLAASGAVAAPVSFEQALQSAQQFAIRGPLKVPKQGGNVMSLAYEARNVVGQSDFYVFNRGTDAGYVLVSGDDRTVPILGYSDDGSFDYDQMPDNMRWWLSEYQKELQTLRDNPHVKLHQPTKVARKVNPLIATMWNQSSPYNKQCPTFTLNGETRQAVTGCVATAMAQIMNYHRWPNIGEGSISYTCDVGQVNVEQVLSADFSQSVYDWNNMLNEYDDNSSTVSQDAVALLMRDCGYSVEMDYKRSSSGAYSGSVVTALSTYFKYDPDLYIVYRDYIGAVAWEQKLREELDANRPIYYSGSSSMGGHAFVLDGYTSDGYFHINWGWGGKSNGYFIISMLNPDDQGIGSFEGGYNEGQQAIFGIQPDDNVVDPNALMGFYASFYPNTSSVTLGNTATFTVDYAAFFGNSNWDTLKWGICIMNEDESAVVGNPVLNLDMSYIDLLEFYSGKQLEYTLPNDLQTGTYHVRLIYSANDKPYKFFGNYPGANAYIKMQVVASGQNQKTATFSIAEESALSLVSLETNSTTLYTGRNFEITAELKNDGAEYFDNIYFALLQNGSQQLAGSPMQVNIAQDGTKTITSQMTAPATAGEYQLALFDVNNHQVGNSITVTVEAASDFELSIVSDLTVPSSVMPADEIRASVQVTNSGGPFMGSLEMFLLPLEGNQIKSFLSSDLVTILPGETVTVNFKCSVGAVVGSSYRLWLRNPNPEYAQSYRVWGQSVVFTIGDYPAPYVAGDVNGDGVVDVGDLNILVSIILGTDQAENYNGRADQDGNNQIDVGDINQLANIILNQ